jgi:hypothetical protein
MLNRDTRSGAVCVNICALNLLICSTSWFIATITPRGEEYDVHASGFAAFHVPRIQWVYVYVSTVFGVLAVVFPIVAVYIVICKWSNRTFARVANAIVFVLFILAVAFPVLWTLAQISSSAYIQKIESRDADVNATFSEYYCNARGAVLCGNTDQSQIQNLVKVFRGGPDDGNSSNNEAMTNVFLGCQHLFIENDGGVSSLQRDFLRGCNTSDVVDQWCGDFILAQVEGSGWRSDNNASLSAPPSINGSKFVNFSNAWRDRLIFDVILLSIVCVLTFVLQWSWIYLQDLEKRHDSSDVDESKYALAVNGDGCYVEVDA